MASGAAALEPARDGGEEEFAEGGDGLLDGVGDFVGGLIDVAEAVGFVDDDEVPAGLADVGLHFSGELIGANDDRVLMEGIEVAGSEGVVEGAGFQDRRGKEELVGEFLKVKLLLFSKKSRSFKPSPKNSNIVYLEHLDVVLSALGLTVQDVRQEGEDAQLLVLARALHNFLGAAFQNFGRRQIFLDLNFCF